MDIAAKRAGFTSAYQIYPAAIGPGPAEYSAVLEYSGDFSGDQYSQKGAKQGKAGQRMRLLQHLAADQYLLVSIVDRLIMKDLNWLPLVDAFRTLSEVPNGFEL